MQVFDCQVLALLYSVAVEAYELSLMVELAAPNVPATDLTAKEVCVTFAARRAGVAYKTQMVREACPVVQTTTTAD